MRWLRATGVVALVGWLASTTYAHGGPPDITFWGPFPSGTAHCLRMMGRKTQRCVQEVLALEQDCMNAQLAGEACDESLRDQQIAAAKLTARAVVTTDCTGGQLTELHFINPDDARTDISKTCTDQPAAAMSVVYAPALASGSSGAMDSQTLACLAQVASSSRTLLRYIVREKTRTLDLMAVNVIAPGKKSTLLKRVADRLTAARGKLAQRLLEVCPNFAVLYGRPPSDVLAALTNPIGNCIVGTAYVQTSVACPLAICGNGVKESGEQCDDGNTIDTDTCHNDCTSAQ